MKLVSPNEIMESGKSMMFTDLGLNFDPSSVGHQIRLMNFVVYNVDQSLAEKIANLMVVIFPDELGMVTESDIRNIIAHFADRDM